MSLIKYSIIGVCVLSGIIGISTYSNLNKIEDSMQKDVEIWNNNLPQGMNVRLKNDVKFSGANGAYIFSYQQQDKKIDFFTLKFKANFNILTLFLANSQLPITGTGVLLLDKLNNEYVKYIFDNKNQDFLTFKGFIERNGNFNINYTQSQFLIGLINQPEPGNKVFFNVSETNGKISKNNKDFNFTSLTPTLEMLDSPDKKEGILITGIKNSLEFNHNNKVKSSIAVLQSSIDSIEDMNSNEKNSDNGLFKINGIDTKLVINEDLQNFKHAVSVNIGSANTQEQKNVKVYLDYDMTVPIESKNAILTLLSSSQSNDLIERQRSAFKIFKTGFNINLKKFEFNQDKEMGSMSFKLNLNPAKEDYLLSDRVSFSGKLLSNGYASLIFKQMVPFASDNISDDNSKPLYEKTFALDFSYNNGLLSFNDKRVPKDIEQTLIKSLVGLDMLMREAEEDLLNGNDELSEEEENAQNFNEEPINEIPGTEENTETS